MLSLCFYHIVHPLPHNFPSLSVSHSHIVILVPNLQLCELYSIQVCSTFTERSHAPIE